MYPGDRRSALAALAAAFLLVPATAALAKHGFRRVYPHSRAVVIQHQGQIKRVPTNVPYAAYDEKFLRLLPNWSPVTISNNRGRAPLWRVTDHGEDLQLTPDHFRVPPSRPNPATVRPLRVEDHEDSWRGRD